MLVIRFQEKSRYLWNINPVSVGFYMKSEGLVYMINSSSFLVFLLKNVTVNCSVILEIYYHYENKVQLCCCKNVVKNCSKCIFELFLCIFFLTILSQFFIHFLIYLYKPNVSAFIFNFRFSRFD